MKKFVLSIYFVSTAVWTQSTNSIYHRDSLKKDFELFQKVLGNYHPGLKRLKNALEVTNDFLNSKNEFERSTSLRAAFLNLHRATSKIRCGHTYPNFWNQNKEIQNELFRGEDKLPFSFVLLSDKIAIHKDVSGNALKPGSIITHINDVPIDEIVKNLKQYARIDGNNFVKFYRDFSVEGFAKFEAFDIIFPMLYPPIDKKYSLNIENHNGTVSKIQVKTVSRKHRRDLLQSNYPDFYDKSVRQWSSEYPSGSIAVLKLGTFAVWSLDLDWKKFLADFFKNKRTQNSKHLVLDLRGNEGGLMEVYWKLLTYLTTEPLKLVRFEQLVAYETVRSEHLPYLESWDKAVFDIRDKVEKKDDHFFKFRDKGLNYLEIEPSQFAFDGTIFVLMDAANSSAGFYLAKYLRENNLATLIGGISGGNQMGTNGGQYFMLKLPYTQLEVDVPLIGYYPRESALDSGLIPDHYIKRNYRYYYDKWVREIDPDYSKVFELTATDMQGAE
ncbi:MAG: S41 family peptidase [Bacteroidota bacterium]